MAEIRKNNRFARINFNVISLFYFILSALSILLFHFDFYFPIIMSLGLMAGVVFDFYFKLIKKRIGALMLILLLVFLLPFVHIPPYLWFDFNSNPVVLWGLVANPYMLDEQIIRLTAMIGATGALGMGFGLSMIRLPIRRAGLSDEIERIALHKPLSFLIWIVWMIIGVGLSWISAPKESIFTSMYTASESIHASMNFSSAWMISYVILTFSITDALIDRDHYRRSLKLGLSLASIFYVVVWLQLLRGDRESVPWVFALSILYFYWAAELVKRKRLVSPSIFKIFICAFLLIILSMVVGGMRQTSVGANLSDAVSIVFEMASDGRLGLSNMLHGTWSAVLLTTLSVSGDHIHNLLPAKFGGDYLNIFLSLPPGFLADALGYIRPLDSTAGPAWEMRYGLGGTHATVVPFLNFKMFGVFVIPAIWTSLLMHYEQRALRRISVINLSFLVTIVTAAPHFLWYGEKSGINAIIIWIVLSFFYRISLYISRIFEQANFNPGGYLEFRDSRDLAT